MTLQGVVGVYVPIGQTTVDKSFDFGQSRIVWYMVIEGPNDANSCSEKKGIIKVTIRYRKSEFVIKTFKRKKILAEFWIFRY